MMLYLTANDIAVKTNVPLRTVQHRLKQSGIEPVMQLRKQKLYKPEEACLLFQQLNTVAPTKKTTEVDNKERTRSDFGTVRKHSEPLTQIAIRYALEYYLDAAMPDVYGACELAVNRVQREYANGAHQAIATPEQVARLTTEWLYKGRVKRRDGDKSKNTQRFVGEYWTQGWEGLHLRKWKQHNAALTAAHVRYNIPEIMESAGLAGPGYGFGKLIMLDDRSADAWVDDGTEYTLPTGVYVWDVLTGALLWVEQADTISAGTYIRAILTTAYTYGFASNPLFFMENAKASTARRVIGAVRSLYSTEELEMIENGCCELRKKLAHGCNTTVAYNLPHIPRHVGKASGERRFGIVKREYDARRHALTFQGGNRAEAVQLHVSNMHWVIASNPNRPAQPLNKDLIPERQFYFTELMQWAYSEYLTRTRVSLKAWAKKHNADSTILSIIGYYSCKGCTHIPDADKLSYLYYWSRTKQNVVRCRNSGCITARKDYETLNITSHALNHTHIGRNIAYIQSVHDNSEYLLYLVDDLYNPIYLGKGNDMTARTLDDVPVMRAEVRTQREATHAREWDMIANTSAPQVQPEVLRLTIPTRPELLTTIMDSDAEGNDIEVIEVDSADVVVEYTHTPEQIDVSTLSAAMRRALDY